mgnify:CR=1 FL=1
MQGLHVEDLVQEGNMALFLKLQELCGTDLRILYIYRIHMKI